MVSGHEKYSKHVRYCSIDCLALSLCSHLCGLYLRTWPHHRAPVPACLACGFWSVFLTVKSGFSSNWSFPGVPLSWEPPGAAWVWGRKGLWMKPKESHRCCCSHYSSRLATILVPQNRSWQCQRAEFIGAYSRSDLPQVIWVKSHDSTCSTITSPSNCQEWILILNTSVSFWGWTNAQLRVGIYNWYIITPPSRQITGLQSRYN